MVRFGVISCLALVAACSTTLPPEPEKVRQDAAPRPTLTSVMLGDVAVRTLAGDVEAVAIAQETARAAGSAFEEDNKGNPCFTEAVLTGVAGGAFNALQTRREEFWTFGVCGSTYEVPVIVTKQTGSEAVAFTVGSGREAR